MTRLDDVPVKLGSSEKSSLKTCCLNQDLSGWRNHVKIRRRVVQGEVIGGAEVLKPE